MADVAKILNLVSQGVLTPEEADEILTALSSSKAEESAPEPQPTPHSGQATQSSQREPRHLRIQVTERGRPVVNLRVPMNVAGWASNYIPGLSDQDADRIRGAIASGMRGSIIDIGDDEDRVLITSE
ncbi:MAG TPA: hypothetical protein VIK00_00365 [Candidatus Limnocylindrales bacterium]